MHYFACLSLCLTVSGGLFAEPTYTAPATQSSFADPLGLARLSNTPSNSHRDRRLSKSEFDFYTAARLEDVAHEKGFKRQRFGGEVILIEPRVDFRAAIRHGKNHPSYLTLNCAASIGTEIRFQGALIRIAPSAHEGFATLAVKDAETWRNLTYEPHTVSYDGGRMALLAMITIQADPTSGLWSIAARDAAVDEKIRVSEGKDDIGTLAILGGDAGALLFEVVSADRNPVIEDANGNWIDDDFEFDNLGALLDAGASVDETNFVRMAYRRDLIQHPREFHLSIPPPDSPPVEQRNGVVVRSIRGDETAIIVNVRELESEGAK